VGLMIFGGAGLVLYVVAWFLIPADGHDASPIESLLRRLGLAPIRIGVVVLLAGVVILFLSIINGADLRFPAFGETPPAFWAVAIIAVGVLLLRRRETAFATGSVPTAAAQPTAPAAVAAPSVPRPHSPLAWYACAAVLLSIGLLALVSQVAEVEVQPGQFFGAALAVIGIGLVVGAWWGRARILILLALLLLPMAVTASFITAPLAGGIGAPRFRPANAAELHGEYRLMSGKLTLDLSQLSVGAQPIHIAASVAVGQLLVILPRDASVDLRARAGAGEVSLFNEYNVGTSLDDVYVRHHQYGTTYILDLEIGIGDVLVINEIGGST
jgi:Cell wall-active antibiotics response 4TMS YvqF